MRAAFALALSLIDLRLLHPAPQSVVRDAKLSGYLGGGFVRGGEHQPEGLRFELVCIARCCSWQRYDSFRRRLTPKLWCVHRPGSTPGKVASLMPSLLATSGTGASAA